VSVGWDRVSGVSSPATLRPVQRSGPSTTRTSSAYPAEAWVRFEFGPRGSVRRQWRGFSAAVSGQPYNSGSVMSYTRTPKA
jgi:hypothetical protein